MKRKELSRGILKELRSRRSTLFITVLLGTILLSLQGTINAQPRIRAQIERLEWLKPSQVPQKPEDYRSPGNLHKIMVEQGDYAQTIILARARVSPWNVYQYHRRKLYLISTIELSKISPSEQRRLTIRDDLNLIRLRDRYFDTTVPQPEVPANVRLFPKEGGQLHLVQFVGPVRDNWFESLTQLEGVTVVDYIPENAYLVWADRPAREGLAEWVDFQYYTQWTGPFHPAYKLHPGFDLTFDGNVEATIQLVTHDGVDSSIATIKAKASEVLRDTYRIGNYTNILVRIPAPELINIVKLEDVVNVEPWAEPVPGGERQGQILANQLNVNGTQPTGPGYLGWLTGLGFSGTFGFVVDVTDTGIDRGQTAAANLHQDFLDAAGNSRVAYVQGVTGTTIDVTAAHNNDTSGHGTIDCAIVGGFNDTADLPGAGTDFEDAAGYQYGLGIAPFVQLGSSCIFNPGWTFPDYTELLNAAYSNGARINNNSWGDRDGANGNYTAESQEYDELVRDARPSRASDGGENGNQEMCIVFIAGNSGPGASTLWNIGSTAKNTIVVGASENWNQAGVDGCGETNGDADNALDVADFSSAGPAQGDRFKPDIMAPGTHIFGAASQDAGYIGNLVCDQYFPAGQTLYAWSSGTSHAAPALAGGSALLYQWFLDHGHSPPSPAMIKAYLMNSSNYMTGARANDDLPSDDQGMGRMNLAMAFDNTPRLIYDQINTCYSSSAAEIFRVNGQVVNVTRPFRVTLAWTDAAGATVAGDVLKNDLDLEVNIGGNFYRGNDFTHGTSNAGNVANLPDDNNNVESVFLAPGQTGNFTITVRPADINYNGILGNSDATDQDFALVIYNAEFPPRLPVDIILVLDRSGSMKDVVSGGTEPKIDLLKDAVELFIRCWEPFAIQNDRMAVVYFNHTLETYPAAANLLPFMANANTIINHIQAIDAERCTGLGGGIKKAYDLLAGSAQPKIVVFTDGMQNCTPMVVDKSGGDLVLKDESSTCGSCAHTSLGAEISLSDKDTPIHTIGTGVYGGSAWWTLLERIADVTNATNHFTSDPDNNLEDYFLEKLVACLKEDPTEKVETVSGTIRQNDPPKEERFALNASVRMATFALSWRGEKRLDALTINLIAPDGTPLPPQQLTHFRGGEFYQVASVRFPFDVHGTEIEPAGTWTVQITPNLLSSQVRYRVHLIVDDGQLRYNFGIPTLNYGVGDPIPLSFQIQHGNRTLSNIAGNVEVNVERPPIGFGSFMVKHEVSEDQLNRRIDLAGDEFPTLAAKKGYILIQDVALRRELAPTVDKIELYDDGMPEHGDSKANDGIYSAIYKKTERPGLYNFTLAFSGHDLELGTIRRSESKTISVSMKQFDLDQSIIEIMPVKPLEGETAYEVNVMLMDGFGNYLGPGHDIDVVVAPPGKKWGPAGRRVDLYDNLDGSYSGRVELTRQEVSAGAQLEIDIDGRKFKTIEPVKPPLLKWSVSIHSGIAIPSGSFANDFDPGFNILLDVDYHFTPQLSLVGLFGYNNFKSKIVGIDDTYWINLSANMKYRRLLRGALSIYIAGGPGYYIPEDGDREFGANAGFGLNYEYSSHVTFELGADYHMVFDPDIQFLHGHAGVIFRF